MTTALKVLRHDTLAVVEIEPVALRWWAEQPAKRVRTGILRREFRTGDRPYLPVSIHWSTKVTVLSGMEAPEGASAGWLTRTQSEVFLQILGKAVAA